LVVVVGDVAPEDVFKLAEQYFGPLQAKTLPPRKPQEEPPQAGIKRLTVKVEAEQPYLLMAYRTPKLIDAEKDWEPYALDMLASVLDGNDAARFSRELVRGSQIANSVDASYAGVGRGPGFFYMSGVPTSGKSVTELEQALRGQVQKVIDDGVTEDELKRIKTQVVASRIYERDSMFFQARQMGSLEAIGFPHQSVDVMTEKFKAVTAEQVREVAKKYLIDDVLTVAYLDPQPVTAGKPKVSPADGRDVQ
jgi:zinc protease